MWAVPMPIHTRWFDAGRTIILIEFVSPWNWEELYAAVEKNYQMIESVNYVVDVLQDWRAHRLTNVNTLLHMHRMAEIRHVRTGVSVAAGASSVFMMMWRAVQKVAPTLVSQLNVYFAPTLEEGVALLREIQRARQMQTLE